MTNLTGRPIIPAPARMQCPCGDERCTVYGIPRVKRMNDGLAHCKGCPCKRCAGGRYKARSRQREHKVAKAIGGKRNIGSGAFGGTDTVEGFVTVEETAQVSLVAGLKRWWLSKQIQDKTAVLMAQKLRPRAFVASWSGKAQLVVMPWSDFAWLCGSMKDGNELKSHIHRVMAELAELESKL